MLKVTNKKAMNTIEELGKKGNTNQELDICMYNGVTESAIANASDANTPPLCLLKHNIQN